MKQYLSFVKFSHTIFAMPFALTGFFIGVAMTPDITWGNLLVWVICCMVFARNAAMGFNRYLDRDIDAVNPRTQDREIPAGVISPQSALFFVGLNAVLFVVAAGFINRLCLYLSPVALAVVLGYSYTKRFTWLCHIVLGLGLALAPVGAYLAVTGHFDWLPVVLGLSVLCWVAGFDVIYALQDDAFDQSQQLYSMPAHFGRSGALRISEGLHVLSAGFMVCAVWLLHRQSPAAGLLSWIGVGVFVVFLVYQHWLVSPKDLSRVNRAFFTANGIAGVVFGVFTIADLYL